MIVGKGAEVRDFLSAAPFFAAGPRRFKAARVATPGPVFLEDRELSTQAGFGKILDALAAGEPSWRRVF